MKRISFLLTMLCCLGVSSAVYAQKGKVAMANSYYTSGRLDMAKKLIDEAMENNGCEGYDKGFFLYGQIYQSCLESSNPDYRNMVKNSDVKNILDAYKKVEALDDKDKFNKKLNVQFKNLAIDYQNYAIELYNEAEYSDAHKAFVQILAIEADPLYLNGAPAKIDTAIIYHAALSAHQAEEYDNAVKYYKMLIPLDYKGERIYEMLTNVLKNDGKEKEAVTYLHEGIKKYPTNEYMLVEMINYYLDSENPSDAIPYLDDAIALNPNSTAFIRAKANIYEKIKDIEKASELYKQVLTLDPNDFYATYELGVIELDKVNAYQAEVQDIVDYNKYNKAMADVYNRYEDVVKYFEKAHEIDATDRNTLYTLKEIYYKLRNKDAKYEDKHKQIVALLNS